MLPLVRSLFWEIAMIVVIRDVLIRRSVVGRDFLSSRSGGIIVTTLRKRGKRGCDWRGTRRYGN